MRLMRQAHDQKPDEKWEKQKQAQNENREFRERNVRGSCGEGPETWSRCNLREQRKGLSLLL